MSLAMSFVADMRRRVPNIDIRVNEPMSKHTSFKIGGCADLLLNARKPEEISLAQSAASGAGLPVTIMGNGTNLLVSDDGIEGLVIKTYDGLSDIEVAGENCISAGSGALLSAVANFAAKQGLGGFEFAHGIPGTLGGAVYMNAGAYGKEMKSVVVKTECVDDKGNLLVITDDEHGFSYRKSVFTRRPELKILKSTIRLYPDDMENIKAKMRELSERRRASQPLEMPSAGSVFKRPEGFYAGSLIQQCGLKGVRVGGAQVSEKHAGFIVNTGGATCRDVLELIKIIQDRVNDKCGVLLEPELKIMGRL